MHPVLFSIGKFTIRSYGVMIALAFFIATLLATHRAKKRGIDTKIIENLSTIAIIAAIIGSRIFYVIFHINEFSGHWLDVISPYQSDGSCGLAGLSMMGGVVFAVLSALIYIVHKHSNFYDIADIIAPVIALGFGIGRIGCFLNGCCFGRPTSSFIGLVFPPNSPAGWVFPNTKIYPTQLFASFAGFFIFLIMTLVEPKVKDKRGFLFGFFFLLYAIDRIIVEYFRYFETNAIMFQIGTFHFTYNGLIAVILGIVGIIFMLQSHYGEHRA